MQLFLDCDGVLADFDNAAECVFGMPPRDAEELCGEARFWEILKAYPGFYRHMPLMKDARRLFEAVRGFNPIILTGCPAGGWAEPQKRAWAEEYFPGTEIICCRSAEKFHHMQPGDILIDDYTKYQPIWENAGGVFIHHRSYAESLNELWLKTPMPPPQYKEITPCQQ